MPDDDGVDFEWLVSSTESAHWQLVHHQQRNKVLINNSFKLIKNYALLD
jgi:hypothetical protein